MARGRHPRIHRSHVGAPDGLVAAPGLTGGQRVAMDGTPRDAGQTQSARTATSLPIRDRQLAGLCEHLGEIHSEFFRHLLHGLQGGISAIPLDSADIGPVQARGQGQLFLAHLRFISEMPEGGANVGGEIHPLKIGRL